MSKGLDAEREMMMARTIAVSAYKAYAFAASLTPGSQTWPWDALPEEAQNGWLRAVFVVIAKTEDANNVAWRDIAKDAYEVYAKALGSIIPWEKQSDIVRRAWEAAAKHILNLFEADDLTEETLQDMEAKWLPWAERKQREQQ